MPRPKGTAEYQPPTGRRCAHCNNFLSGYNSGLLCSPCRTKAVLAGEDPKTVELSAEGAKKICRNRVFREIEQLPSHEEMLRAKFQRALKPFNARDPIIEPVQ